ncbi:hypothetical protein HYU17_02285 [Candidatus Woesearchaeota archaeon]|nr:hypothetical protein [Candidatus Woesearchaeota archaeon]
MSRVTRFVKNVALAPARAVDGVALNAFHDLAQYLVHASISPSANIPPGVKAQISNAGSATRRTLDTAVTLGLGLALADKLTPGIPIWQNAVQFYTGNYLGLAGAVIATTGAVAGLATKKARPFIAGGLVGGALIAASLLVRQPFGHRPLSAPPSPPPAYAEPLSQQGLESYVANTLMPQIRAEISAGQLSPDQLNTAVTTAIDKYVEDVLKPALELRIGVVSEKQLDIMKAYVAVTLANSGYAKASDVVLLGQEVDDLASRLQTAATPVPTVVPTAMPTAVPPTATPVAGTLQRYLNNAGYVVPVSVLRAARASDESGLVRALVVSADNLRTFTNDTISADDGEFVTLEVTKGGVIALAAYEGSGNRTIKLEETDPAAFTGFLQTALSPSQVGMIVPK